ncbi:MAG: SGNH/GDSL hydrolase family protein [Gemmataceae bacterium]
MKKADERGKPVVFYGTSITQGGCASRPGMVHTAILGRRFDVPVINLGFSGSGTLDPEMGDLIAEIDAAAYVLDCLPNLAPKQTAERTEPFVKALRKARPNTPIVLVEDRNYANAPWNPGLKERNTGNHAANKAAFDSLTAAGIKGLHYIPGERLIGDDGEGTVDGSHPTDLGFLRQAEVMAEVLAPLLKKK